MRFCFIIEAQYRNEPMPMVVAHQLMQWGHEVDVLEPQTSITCLSDITGNGYDAFVLKTVSDGPGLSILEAAEAAGIAAINKPQAIRQVRDKAVAIARAQAYGLPVPRTYFAAHQSLLSQVPEEDYPLVVKPTNGSSCRGIYKVNSPRDLAALDITGAENNYLLAQHYAENGNFDIKLYVAGTQVYAIAKRSPLHPDVAVEKHRILITLEMRALALQVGDIFGLDIYGLDIVETPDGSTVVDINDFPSFGHVPDATTIVAAHLIEVATRQIARRMNNAPPARYIDRSTEIAVSA
ncbi:MAG: ATP-grasp domain-containing protein [Ktedonobacteraceae bacterium]